jgi:hypothetical protein
MSQLPNDTTKTIQSTLATHTGRDQFALVPQAVSFAKTLLADPTRVHSYAELLQRFTAQTTDTNSVLDQRLGLFARKEPTGHSQAELCELDSDLGANGLELAEWVGLPPGGYYEQSSLDLAPGSLAMVQMASLRGMWQRPFMLAPHTALPKTLAPFPPGEYLISLGDDLAGVGLVVYSGVTVAWARIRAAEFDMYVCSAPETLLSGADLAHCASQLAAGESVPMTAAELGPGRWPGLVTRDFGPSKSPSSQVCLVLRPFVVSAAYDVESSPVIELPSQTPPPPLPITRAHNITNVALGNMGTFDTPQPSSVLAEIPDPQDVRAHFLALATVGFAVPAPGGTLLAGWAHQTSSSLLTADGIPAAGDLTAIDLSQPSPASPPWSFPSEVDYQEPTLIQVRAED